MTWQEFIDANHFDKPKFITKLSDYVMTQQGKCLGRLIRAPREDKMKIPTIKDDLTPMDSWNMRVGKSRLKWVTENCKYMYKYMEDDEFEHEDYLKTEVLRNHAMERHF